MSEDADWLPRGTLVYESARLSLAVRLLGSVILDRLPTPVRRFVRTGTWRPDA